MARYFVVLYMDSFYTTESGDISGEGEFYFKCNKKRYPDKGILKMGKKETFAPEPKPNFYTAVLDSKEKEVKFDVQVMEEDVGRDDTFIDKEFKYPLQPMNQGIELRDKKNKCLLKLVLRIEETKIW